jgi:hypothetical protein
MSAAGYSDLLSSHTRPYLFATECPFAALTSGLVSGRRVLSIAGSGDVPLHCAARGARAVLAVDVSEAACALCGLKSAALRTLAYTDFLWFFLAGMDRAAPFLEKRGLDPRFRPDLWLELCRALPGWNPETVGEPRDGSLHRGTNPFSRWLRPTDLWCLEQISYLADPAVYAGARDGAGLVTVVRDEVAAYLERESELWDVVYLSNVPEYVRSEALARDGTWTSDLERLFRCAAGRLAPGGRIVWYVFHDPAAPDECYERCVGILEDLGLKARCTAIRYRPDVPLGSRFTNGLVVAGRDFFP